MNKDLQQILSDVFQISEAEIHLDLHKNDVDSWDSLKQMDLVVSLEKQFSIILQFPDILRMLSVSGIIEVLKEKGVSFDN